MATNLELGKVKEAAACAREAIACMPRSSLGYLAMGMVFSVSQPNSAEVSVLYYFESVFSFHFDGECGVRNCVVESF